MFHVPTAHYKGATYIYQPALREIVIRPPDGGTEFRLPVCRKVITESLDQCAEELREFWREVLKYN